MSTSSPKRTARAGLDVFQPRNRLFHRLQHKKQVLQSKLKGDSLRVCTQNGFASQDLFRGKAACDRSGAHHVGPMPRTSTPSPADLPSPSARHLPRVRRGDGWDALADIEVFVFAV